MAAEAKSSEDEPAANGLARVTSLGEPCQARNVNSGLVLQDAGRDWLVLGNMNENSHMELIFVDPEKGEGEVYRAPAGSGSWALQPLPGNRLAVGTFYDGMFMVFDVTKREWVKTVKFPGESYLWTFAVGKDGRVYGGTYPGGKLGTLDPDTCAFEDLGRPSPENEYLRYTSALPDGRIFCQCGYKKPATFIFDPATKQFTPAPAHLQDATQGIVWNGYFVLGDRAYRMPNLTAVDPLPFPTPDSGGGAWSVDLRLTTSDTLVLRQGSRVYRYRAADAGLTLWAELPHKGVGALFGVTRGGTFTGVRGQDYFAVRPGDREATLRRIPGEAAPRDTHFLYADDRGRLWGGPSFGQTLFYQDVRTGKTVNTRCVSDKGGEVYGVEVVEGVVYAVAYAGGEVIRFDPAAEWDQVNHVNPKTVVTVGPDYIRPSAGITRGPDGRLYSGWLAKYGVYGGLLAITDPKTGATETVKDPLGPHGLSGLAVAGDLVLLGTTLYGNGLGNQKDAAAQFGVYDLKAGKTVFAHLFSGAVTVSSIVHDPATGLAAFLVDSRLWLFDTNKLALAGDGPALPDNVTSVLAARGGSLLYGQGAVLRQRAFATGQAKTLAELPARIDKIAVDPRGELYAACGAAVYRVEA